MDEAEKKAFDLEEKMGHLYNSGQTQELAVTLVEAKQTIDSWVAKEKEDTDKKDEPKVDLKAIRSNLERKIEDLFTQLSRTSMHRLLDLSFELLKLESEKQQNFVYDFLNG